MGQEGEVNLTELQGRLLELLARDMTVREISAEVAYSRVWVYHELQALRETLGVRTNAGAVLAAVRLGKLRVTSDE